MNHHTSKVNIPVACIHDWLHISLKDLSPYIPQQFSSWPGPQCRVRCTPPEQLRSSCAIWRRITYL